MIGGLTQGAVTLVMLVMLVMPRFQLTNKPKQSQLQPHDSFLPPTKTLNKQRFPLPKQPNPRDRLTINQSTTHQQPRALHLPTASPLSPLPSPADPPPTCVHPPSMSRASATAEAPG